MINLYDILDAADGQLFGEPAAQIFSGFCFDYRLCKQGELFVALKTEHGDGHHYMEDAIKMGAIGIMCTHPPTFDTSGVTVMIMRDVEAALVRWTKYILAKYGTTVVAITGSNGKSTTKEAIAHVLRSRYEVYAGTVSLDGRFGIPLALGGLNSQHQLAVLEFASAKVGDMAEMVQMARPTVGVITNITSYDADTLANEARIMIDSLPDDGLAIFNYDDAAVRSMTTNRAKLTISVDKAGTSFGADLTAYNIIVGLDKTGFDIRYGNQRHIAKWVPLLGAHQLYAVLSALSLGLSFSVTLEEGLSALTTLEPLAGRMRALEGMNNSLLIDDTYSANPESLLRALDWVEAVSPSQSVKDTETGQLSRSGKLYVVLGEVTDAGKTQQYSTLEMGKRLANVASVIVTEGNSAAALARAAVDQGFPLAMTNITFSVPDAILALKDKITEKDVVLVKGNATARMERVIAALLANSAKDRAKLPRQELADTVDTDERPSRSTWIQVDMEAIAANVQRLKQILGTETRLMAVVKANAYGHGAIPVSTTAVLNGADYLGVASIDEALELREAGITAPILIMGYTSHYMARQVINQDIAITLYDLTLAKAFQRAAVEADKPLKVHVRVDVGLSGMGLVPDEVPSFFRGLMRLERLKVEGLYIHLDTATNNQDVLQRQLHRFEEIIGMLKAAEYKFEYIHAAGSGVALHLPEARFNMVRCGLALYGLQPGDEMRLPDDFRPAMTWKTSVVQVKRIVAGTMVGYGSGLSANKAISVAVLPVGFSDGFRRDPNRWEAVLIKGKRAPIFGQVGMYQTLVDVSQIEDVRVGDEVVLIGAQGEDRITIEDAARALQISNYELIGSIMPRGK